MSHWSPAPERRRYAFSGSVQGVGFRPFVYRLATEMGLAGFVRNSLQGAVVEVEGPAFLVEDFLGRLEAGKPPACWIASVESTGLTPRGETRFTIAPSEAGEGRTAFLLPDLAPCAECLAELHNPQDRRHGYPFLNCTRCGPRYSILLGIPYDRPNTTMARFPLCDACAAEYRNPQDRRFHAQPVACPACGPRLLALSVDDAATLLTQGGIIALKGVGGFQLLCDARNPEAVARLRERKHREEKPFAVLFPSLSAIREFAFVSEAEARLLGSAAAPIVLLRPRTSGLPSVVSAASPYLGAMLPASPLHVLLTARCPYPLVATSGNRTDEPIAIDNEEARARLGAIADGFVLHNRPIARPCDDSVARVSQQGVETILRRARGYAPLPVLVREPLPPVLALGAHLKNTVGIALGRQVHLSQHIGDLETAEAFDHFRRTAGDLCRLYEFTPDRVACDLHPDYRSTKHAKTLGLPVIPVQHHVAHVAACAAENDVDEPYLGVAWDGAGYGLDGTIWGSEFFHVSSGRFTRCAHLLPFRLPGGEQAMRDCRRVAFSLLEQAGLDPEAAGIAPQTADLLRKMLARGVNSPLTTSAGRLFDAVTALTGIAASNAFEGQAPLRLEAAASAVEDAAPYPAVILEKEGGLWLDWRPLLAALLEDTNLEAGIRARRFHHALAVWVAQVARRTGSERVVLSGGCFQNQLLAALVARELEAVGIRCYVHQRAPPNDGGIALGQAVVAGLIARGCRPVGEAPGPPP